MNEIKNYLRNMGHTEQTIKTYIYEIENYLTINPDAKNYKYKNVLNYFAESKNNNNKNSERKSTIIAAIKKYYDYLIEAGKRNDHPCKTLVLKSWKRKEIIHQDLFSSEELEMLTQREERYEVLKLKNQTLISLLIYQALTAGEIINLKTKQVNLDSGTIFIKESRKYTRRNLEIQPKQYRILDKYINESRKELINTETEILLIGKLGNPITIDDISYITSTQKLLFPDRNLNPQTIRKSVISNWLNEKNIPLEQVQMMAGHKWISATERYRYKPIEEQRELINKFHPLK